MKENEILEQLKNAFNDNNTVETYVYIEEAGNTCVKKFNLQTNDLQLEIFNLLKTNTLSEFQKDNELAFSKLSQYANKENEYCIIDSSEFDRMNFMQSLDNISESYMDSSNEKLKGLIYKVGTFEKYIIIYEPIYAINLKRAKKNNILLYRNNEPRFNKFNGNIINISAKPKVLLLNGLIITKDLKFLKMNFGFNNYIKKVAEKVFENVKSMDIISDSDFMEQEIENYKTFNKLSKAADSKIFKINKTVLLGKIKTSKYYKDKLKIENNQICINTKRQLEVFLKLLNDSVVFSDLTDNYYEAEQKKDLML